MGITESSVREALSAVRFPGFRRDIVSLGILRDVVVDGGTVRVRLDLGAADPKAVGEPLRAAVREAVGALAGVGQVEVRLLSAAPNQGLSMAGTPPGPAGAAVSGSVDPGLVPGVRHIVAVASGKGGVGKSTVAVNLAIALSERGLTVGLLDADIYGPSIPTMMGIAGQQPTVDPDRQALIPFERHGIRFMSLGFLVPPDQAVIWRGPMVMKAIEQLLRDVAWGELDVLVVDMPPGTGDAQLTLSQRVRLAGAVIVSTPQDVALADAIKGVAMFRKVDVPVLGIVENMSFFLCPHCGERSEIFGHDGARVQAERLAVPFLGAIPLDPAIRASGDDGEPVARQRGSAQARAFDVVATAVADAIGLGRPAREARR